MELYRVEAAWIGTVRGPEHEIGLFVFQKRFEVGEVPESVPVQVSADQRYRLYVNGQFVGYGPQADDTKAYKVDPYDLAPFLKSGENVVRAVVSNYGGRAALWQYTQRLAFLLEGTVGELEISTGETPWDVAKVPGFEFGNFQGGPAWTVYRVSPGEKLSSSIAHWPELGDDLEFEPVNHIERAMSGQELWATSYWFVRPREIPVMKYEAFAGSVTRVLKDGFRVDLERYEVPAGERVLIDVGEETTGFPRFTLSSAEGAQVHAIYCEALLDPDNEKGNRNETVGKRVEGYGDLFALGSEAHVFEPFLWRSFRYIELKSDKPFVIEDFEVMETGYPLGMEASFTSDIPDDKEIWDVAFRTAKRCARESYMDCPYYEELQYAGDTRIQAFVGYYTSRDRRLQRNAVDQLTRAVLGDGLVSSRAPCRENQSILPFHWWTMMMITDLVLHDPEAEWGPGTKLTGIWDRMWQGMEEWMTGWRAGHDYGSWMFGDWVDSWPTGAPPNGRFHPMHILARQVVWDLRRLVDGESGPEDLDELTKDLEVDSSGVFVGSTGRERVPTNEHSEALRRYRRWIFGLPVSSWPDPTVFTDRTTLYYSYYRHLVQDGVPYSEQLAPWRRMLELGLSTFPEKEDSPRSDCHAWSAHPILGFMQRVAGVRSIASGWKRALVAPHPTDSLEFRAVVPHPAGDLVVARSGDRLAVETPVPVVVDLGGSRVERGAGSWEF